MRACGRACCECVTLSVGSKLSLLVLLNPEAQIPNFSDTAAGRDGCPCPHHPGRWVQSPSSLRAGGLSPFSASPARTGSRCCLYPLTKARPARPAVSEFLWLGGNPHFLFSLQPQRAVQSACLLEAAALTSGLGQVNGTWVTQHWEEKAEESLIGGQKSSFTNVRIV